MCAGRRTGGLSVCKGDSGGPLVHRKDSKTNGKIEHYFQIGITQGTFNVDCDDTGREIYPSIFTRTESFDILNFIRKNIGLTGN